MSETDTNTAGRHAAGASSTSSAGASSGAPTEPEAAVPHRYTNALAGELERRWQDYWEATGTFHTPNPRGALSEVDPQTAAETGVNTGAEVAEKSKFFLMDMFPYPSGAGLHVGHPLGYIATDVMGRFRRMCGDNVLHALSYDAFGLPAEQYAVQTGRHPRETTEENITNMRRQLRRLGLAHDPRRSFATIDPGYVKWTQWIFLKIFNSWYDVEADGGRGRARPISELVDELESGRRPTPDGRPWAELDEAERRRIIDDERLAYISQSPVNWCPGLGTVLANEEVTAEGRSERGNFPVFKRDLRQWMMRITAYADRLVDDLDRIDWPEKVKTMQRNWIGRSTGASVRFATPSGELEVFTTRPDTLFGATFMVVAPEHPLVDGLTAGVWPEGTKDAWTGGHETPQHAVTQYRRQAAAKTEIERQAADTAGREKTGVFTGSFATNPATGEAIPVFIADYVLMGYGTGAIMAVPGQDERDWEFAERFELPIVRTVQPPDGFDGNAYVGDGLAINSANADVSLNGLAVDDAKAAIIGWLESTGAGEGTVTYRLRDWLFSRQRYWGEPFPIVYDDVGPVALDTDSLPVLLPEVPDYSPKIYDPDAADTEPEPPLARVPEWVEVDLDLGDGRKRYRRDTNTMPNWAGSCWYHLRYLDPTNDERVVDPEIERYWMGPQPQRGPDDPGGVDLYVGGVEHAVLHLLYARFWHKVLFDLGHVSSEEPYYRLFNQGYIQAFAYTDSRGQYLPAEQVVEETDGDKTAYVYDGEPVNREYGKMGKSLKNVVTPDEMYEDYGADTFRVYEMSMGPLDDSRPWDTRAVIGSLRFLQRVWRNVLSETTGDVVVSDEPADDATRRAVHRTIDAVRSDMDGMRFNTAIARLIELNNYLTKLNVVPREAAEALVLMVAPVAPHIAEELWSRLGHPRSLAYESFPQADPALLVEETVTCVVQVGGKVRDRLEVSPSADDDTLRELALASDAVERALAGRSVRTVIVRAPKLVNVVPA